MTKEEIIKAVWNQLPDLTVHEARKIYQTDYDSDQGFAGQRRKS